MTTRSYLARLACRRPEVVLDFLVWGLSIYTTAALNQAFWMACTKAGLFKSTLGWVTAFSLALIITSANAILLRILCTRLTAKPVLLLFLLTAVAVSFFSSHYGTYFDVSMMRNVMQTDVAEASQLLTWGLLKHILLYSTLPVVVILWVRLAHTTALGALANWLITVGTALILIVVAALFSFRDASALMRNHRELRHLIAPANVVVSLGRVLAKTARGTEGQIRKVVGADAKLDAHEGVQKPHVLVIVVGETVRASNWGLNGYVRQTTPHLSKMDVVNFPDVRACGSSTEVSLPCMFSANGRNSYDEHEIRNSESLLHVLERAGISTSWRDNQGGCKGVCKDLPFESVRDMRDTSLCDDSGCQDGVLLGGLRERIEGSTGDQVIVLHQMGNHGPSYYLRYPGRLRQFTPDCRSPDLGECSQAQIVNAYDNAILATDELVAETIRTLQTIPDRDSALIYVSDHGESLGEKNLYLHGMPYAIAPDDQLKVPMVAWVSPGLARWRGLDIQCVKASSDGPASHDNLFHSVLGLMQVATGAYRKELDLFARCTNT
jgi:lipid A ethanolaminephosphotransferase